VNFCVPPSCQAGEGDELGRWTNAATTTATTNTTPTTVSSAEAFDQEPSNKLFPIHVARPISVHAAQQNQNLLLFARHVERLQQSLAVVGMLTGVGVVNVKS
jgi:hypothetical protein